MTNKINVITTKEELIRVSAHQPFAFVIWCFWYQGQMNENRTRSFEMMKSNLGVPLCLITKDNLPEFILPEHPLHPAFHFLSDVHKSDYLRIYFLHHYGGGWHDIKPTLANFQPVWDAFADQEVYFVGRAEVKGGPAKVFDSERRWMPDFWNDLVGCGWWVGRPNTPLSSELLKNMNELLDAHYELLKQYPAKTPFDKKKKSKFSWIPFIKPYKGYPLPWTLFGNIFHPLNYKYRAHVKRNLPKDEIYNAGLPYR